MKTYNSLHSPKNAYRVEIHFEKPVKGLGSSVSYTSDDVEGCERLATMQAGKEKNVYVKIMKNEDVFPKFNWVTVKTYYINK